MNEFIRLLMTALLLFGAMPLSYANIHMSMSTSGASRNYDDSLLNTLNM